MNRKLKLISEFKGNGKFSKNSLILNKKSDSKNKTAYKLESSSKKLSLSKGNVSTPFLENKKSFKSKNSFFNCNGFKVVEIKKTYQINSFNIINRCSYTNVKFKIVKPRVYSILHPTLDVQFEVRKYYNLESLQKERDLGFTFSHECQKHYYDKKEDKIKKCGREFFFIPNQKLSDKEL